MIIRQATSQDRPGIETIVQDAYVAYVPRIGRKPGPMLDDYGELIAAGETFVVEDGGHVLGVLVLKDEPDALLLENVAVHPEAQGRGLGRGLISFAQEEARRRGHPAIRLYTNEAMTENVAFYERLGFVETHRCEDKGFRRVFMTKKL